MRSLKVQLEDFRSFKRIDPVHIAPITFLIGQNSTGKTSFLSALNYIFEFQERGSPQLSSEPFDLGSFKQLVHKEQEKSFSIKFSETINLGNSSGLIPFFIRQFSARMFEKPPVKKRELVDASLEIVFSDHFGSAEVCSLKFRIEESLLSIDLRPEFLVELDFDDKLISFEPEGGMQPPPIINSESGLKVGSLILLLQAIVSSFYTNEEVGEDQKEAAQKVLPYFPNQNDRGTHMNISGGGILKNSPNPENAKKLLEFLLTKEAQQHIVNNTFEYPMIEGVEPHHLIKKMGENFKQDLKTKVGDYKKNQADALEVMLMSGWK